MGRGHQLGLTLIEVAVALAVAGLVALAIFGLFRIGVALHQRSAQTIAAGEAAIALDSIARTLRETSRDPDAFRVWPTQPDTERAETVAIRTARASGGFVVGEEGTPQWVVGWIGFAYDPSRRAVIRADFPEGNEVPPPPWTGRVVARQARAFNVQRDGDRFVITLVLEGGDSTLTLTTTVWPRNR